MTYNPSAPNTIGQEWRPYLEGVLGLSAAAQGVGVLVPSSVGETADQLQLPHQWLASPSSGYGRLWTDVYDMASSPVAGAVTELTYTPNEVKTFSNVTKSDFATTTNMHLVLDDVDDSGPPEASDYVLNANYGGSGSYIGLQFNTAAIPSSWRIVYVKIEIRFKGFDWSWQQPVIRLDWYNNSTRLGTLPGATLTPPQDYVFRTQTLGPYYWDFYNEGPWLQPEIANLDVNTSRNLRVRLDYACAVSRVTLKVGVIPENRVAVAIGPKQTVPPSGVQTNHAISYKTPLNVDNWAKASGKSYLHVVRRLEDPFAALSTLVPQIEYLDSGAACPHGIGQVYDVTLTDTGGGISATPAASGTKTAAPIIGTSGGAQSVDSQPYHDVEAKSASWTYLVSQAMAGASAQSYRRLRAMVARVSGTTPASPLSLGVRRTTASTGAGDATETWTGTNGNPWPAQWTSGSGTTAAAATIQTNAGQMTTGTTAAGYYRHLLNVALNAQVLVQSQVTFAAVAAANSARIFLGAATFTSGVLNSGYEVRLTANTNTVGLYRTDAAGAQVLLTSAAFTVAAATAYQVKVYRLSQGYIGVKVWTGTEPDAMTLVAIDATHTISRLALGVLGGADASSDTITFDTLTVWQYLTVGDLAAADLADTAIATSKGTAAYAPGTMDVYDVTVTMDAAATLASATDYTIDAGAGVDYATGWFLLWVDSTSGHALTGNQTYGGSTDAAAVGGGVTTAGADFQLTLGSVPTAPASITLAAVTVALPDNGSPLCNPGTMTKARVTWAATALGASFSRYEVQRSADGGATWEDAAYVTAEATLTFDDRMVARGVAHTYRVRVLRTDGAFSDWRTAVGSVTCPATEGAVLFVSNDDDVEQGYVLLSPEQTYDFLSADEVVFQRMYARDYQVAFHPTEDRGFRWQFPVLIYTGDDGAPASGRGPAAFDGVRTVGENVAAYLCMLTPSGGRYFGAVQVHTGTEVQPGQFYVAQLIFTQTQGSPTVVTI